MDEQNLNKLVVLHILQGGPVRYADAQTEYGRRAGVGGEQLADAFAQLVQGLVADKLIGSETDPGATAPVPFITLLRLRPRGKATLEETDLLDLE
jgi:hypothetical protein